MFFFFDSLFPFFFDDDDEHTRKKNNANAKETRTNYIPSLPFRSHMLSAGFSPYI